MPSSRTIPSRCTAVRLAALLVCSALPLAYADGGEELYDETKDPYEWTNLAAEAGMSDLKMKLAAALPQEEVKPTSGEKKQGEGKGKKKKQAE